MKVVKSLVLIIALYYCCISCVKSTQKQYVVIAHRGASGYLPEHTLPAKALAFAMDPDYIEQDVVLSKDDIPIVIHDIFLDTTTNVKDIFPDRCRSDKKYYVIDFTWKELQELNVTERFNLNDKKAVYTNRFPKDKSIFKLHTLADELELIQGLNKSMQKNVGVYVEIKEPEFHKNHQKDISKIVLNTLDIYGYKTKQDNCIVQCFDAKELQKIREEYHSNLFLVQLLEIGYLDEPFKNKTTRQIINYISKYADGVGPWYKQLVKGKHQVTIPEYVNLVLLAHEYHLKVHAFTFRADDIIGFSSFEELLAMATELKVDGVFTDHPDLAINFLRKRITSHN